MALNPRTLTTDIALVECIHVPYASVLLLGGCYACYADCALIHTHTHTTA